MKNYWKILLIIFIMTFASCDIFQVRDPEEPRDTRSGYRVPVQPSDVIQNLINAFNEKNSND